jgi:uncharacterized Zn ribbon protein
MRGVYSESQNTLRIYEGNTQIFMMDDIDLECQNEFEISATETVMFDYNGWVLHLREHGIFVKDLKIKCDE